MSFPVLFLSDHETYSGIYGYICVFDDKYQHEDDLNDVTDHKDINLEKLLKELKNKKELLPLEIQELIEPLMECEF